MRAVVWVADSLMRRDYFGEYEGGDGHAHARTRSLAVLRSFTAAKYAAVYLSYDVWVAGRVFLRRDRHALHVRNLFTCTYIGTTPPQRSDIYPTSLTSPKTLLILKLPWPSWGSQRSMSRSI
jgi:hypothetical protein